MDQLLSKRSAAMAAKVWRLVAPKGLSQEAVLLGECNDTAREVINSCRGATLKSYFVFSKENRRLHLRLFEPPESNRQSVQRCAVVYCPSEVSGGSCAMESASLTRKLLPLGIAVLAIDVSPTATSLCTLDDVAYAVERLKEGLPNREPYPCVALWGRSAGAVAAIGYAAKDTPSLAGIVCDSAFSDLATLLQMPEWAASPLASMLCLAKTASSLAEGIGGKTAISDLRIEVHPLEAVKQCYVPAMFMHGAEDTLVPKEHAKCLREAYGGEAQLLLFPGEHDDQRTKGAEAKAALFLARAFRLEGPAVVNLEQVTCDLVRDTAALAGMEEQAAALLASKDSGDRRHGLLLKAIASCPSYRGPAFAKVMARAGRHSSPSTGERYVRYNILVTLPSIDSEVVIAWATEPNPAFPGLSPSDRGFVHFAVISCGCLSLQRMRLYESREASEDTPMFAAASVLLDIKDLGLQESRLKPRLVPYTAKLFLQDSGSVELRVGAACLRWAGAAEARPSFQPLSCGYSIFGAALLTAESKSARIEFVDCKDEICAESGEAADGRGLGMGGMGGVGSEVYFIGTTPPPPEQHVLCTGQKSPGLEAAVEEPKEVEEEQEEELKTLPHTFADEFEEAVAKFHLCIPGQLLSLPGEQFSCTSGSLLSGTSSGSFFLSKPMESPDIPADSLAISSMESSKSNEVRCSRVLQRTETPIFGVAESGSLPKFGCSSSSREASGCASTTENPASDGQLVVPQIIVHPAQDAHSEPSRVQQRLLAAFGPGVLVPEADKLQAGACAEGDASVASTSGSPSLQPSTCTQPESGGSSCSSQQALPAAASSAAICQGVEDNSDSERGSLYQIALGQSRSWPDIQESQSLDFGRRHSWASPKEISVLHP